MPHATALTTLFTALSSIAPQALTTPHASAARCYDVATGDAPDREEFLEIRASPRETSAWCYADFDDEHALFTAIFKADDAKLAAVVQRGPDGRPRAVAHAIRWQGATRIVTSGPLGFSPLPVPLSEAALPARQRPIFNAAATEVSAAAFAPYFAALAEAPKDEPLVVHAGTFSSMLPDERIPWNGNVWNYALEELYSGPYASFPKYDRIMTARTGTNPDVTAWEANRHTQKAVLWGGHCNGWVAAASLYPEPRAYLWDHATQTVLSPREAKGLLQEAFYCVEKAFFGRRFYDRPGDDLNDVYPDVFHRVITHYIDGAKMPVAMDYMPDRGVDNNLVTGYELKIDEDAARPRHFNVTATLRMHAYADFPVEAGLAETYLRTYAYSLETNEAGEVIAGTWATADHPDFLWVPLAQKSCGNENPRLDAAALDGLLKSLPEAHPVEQVLDKALGADLEPSGEVEILHDVHAFDPVLTFRNADELTGLMLKITYFSRYPSAYESIKQSSAIELKAADGVVTVPLAAQAIESVVLFNPTAERRSLGAATLHAISYLGGD